MKAYVLFTERPPVLIVTAAQSLRDPRLVARLTERGITRFIAHEVPLEQVRRRYGLSFRSVERELADGAAVCVLDHNGAHVLHQLPLASLGKPVRSEAPPARGSATARRSTAQRS
jgi:predicted dehydrogenase